MGKIAREREVSSRLKKFNNQINLTGDPIHNDPIFTVDFAKVAPRFHQIGVGTAFLVGDLKEDIFLEPPELSF